MKNYALVCPEAAVVQGDPHWTVNLLHIFALFLPVLCHHPVTTSSLWSNKQQVVKLLTHTAPTKLVVISFTHSVRKYDFCIQKLDNARQLQKENKNELQH